jgi:hypothetical protein
VSAVEFHGVVSDTRSPTNVGPDAVYRIGTAARSALSVNALTGRAPISAPRRARPARSLRPRG